MSLDGKGERKEAYVVGKSRYDQVRMRNVGKRKGKRE